MRLPDLPETFRCYWVTEDDEGNVSGRVTERRLDELPNDELLIRVAYSSLNYKDALAATGNRGVNRVFPHIPGVDASGVVVRSGVFESVEGDEVLVTGFDMGANRWGGFAEYLSVPHEWIVDIPPHWDLREPMMLGTAGFTAALSVDALQRHDVNPDRGEVVVTGASGGVGTVAVALLAKLGYTVVAVTGKPEAVDLLKELGAVEVVGREAVSDTSGKALLSGRWAGAIDTVGSAPLETVLRMTRHGGCVATCGNAAGNDLKTTVFPFILRGVTLQGIDASRCPPPARHEAWSRLAGPWRLDCLERISRFIELDDLPEHIEKILAGKMTGRAVVRVHPPHETSQEDA